MVFEKYLDSARIALWLKNNFYILLSFLALAVLIGLAEIGRRELTHKKESRIQGQLYEQKRAFKLLKAKAEAKEKTEETKKGKAAVPPPSTNILGEPPPPAFKWTEALREQASLYEKVIRTHHKNKISLPFAIDLADIYHQSGEIEKAKELLMLFAFPDRASSLYHLASFQLSAYYADAKECEKALPLLIALGSNLKASAFHLDAGVREGLCLEDLNRPQEAKDRYEKLSLQDPNGYVGRLAKDYKKILILSEKLDQKSDPRSDQKSDGKSNQRSNREEE